MSAPRIMTIAQMWEEFAAYVLVPGTPAVQRQDMRRAFYGGAYAMLMTSCTAVGDESVSEADGIACFEAWRAEAQQFNRDVEEGRA